MKPIRNDRLQKLDIDLTEVRIELFLMEQRRTHRNDSWFTVAQIADEVGLRSGFYTLYYALKRLASKPKIEQRDGEIRCSA